MYNIYIMNPYTTTNFGNTHIELLNLPSLKMFTYAIPRLYLKPITSETPCNNTHIMIINAHYLRGAKCNIYLRP
jgi:hypothetical protein